MSIRVTCPGCHTRFNVSEKFAGREGPCPKCKKKIKIPETDEAVKVHAPENFGPKSTTGQAVLKPIFRQEASISPVQWVLIGATIVGFIALAFLMRGGVTDKDSFSSWILLAAAIVLAVPCVYASYTFLRDSELGGFQGQELWMRVGLCAAVYGISWLAIPAITYAMGDGVGTAIGVALMFVAGSCAAYLLMGIDFFMGILHYGMFFGCAVLMRVAAGFTALPSTGSDESKTIDDMLNAAAVVGGCFV